MTVYTVIGHITNAILTIEQLQIPSNLSGGPHLSLRTCEVRDVVSSQALNRNHSDTYYGPILWGRCHWCKVPTPHPQSEGISCASVINDLKTYPQIRERLSQRAIA